MKLQYKVWDDKDKKWVKNVVVDSDGILWWQFGYSMDLVEGDRYIVCLNTLLKDKNGSEIYEGDIVKTEGFEGNIEVKWNEDLLMWDFPRYGDESLYGVENLEIMGNIYENPELLK